MATKHTNSNRKLRPQSRHLLYPTAFLCALSSLSMPGQALATSSVDPSPSATQETAQTNDLVLKMVIEAMMHLLNDIENIHDFETSMASPKESLLEAAEALVWVYANLGVEDDLTLSEVVQGIEDCEFALDLIRDPANPPMLPPALLNLLDTAVEGISNDLEAEL